jgi:hypothetical protein
MTASILGLPFFPRTFPVIKCTSPILEIERRDAIEALR